MDTILANPEVLAATVDRIRTFAPQVEDVLRRVLAAGAEVPLTFVGIGGSAAVFCDRRGRGWKVARDEEHRGMLREEAAWLETASSVPWVRERVARFGRWHDGPAVIERECVRPSGSRRASEKALIDLHGELGRLMRPYGWGAPEFKLDSYVMTRDRGPVLVDASSALRVGHRLARDVVARHTPGGRPFDRESARWELRMELGGTVPEGVGQRLHDRLAAADAAGTYANPARAARPYSEGRVYHPEPATLTEGHFDLPEVRRAAEVASWVTNQDWRPHDKPWGWGRYLGEGNFGVAWRAESPEGERFVVKLPAARDIHGRAWPRDSQRDNLAHEAGVANELEGPHPTLVPHTVYTEFMGGTPAIVREYGEPVESITPAEYEALERELLAVEREDNWRVGDEIVLYRRPDGSLFVGDVGFWRAPSRDQTRRWKAQDTNLDGELGTMQRRYLVDLPVDPEIRTMPGHEWRARRGFTTLAAMVDAVEGVRREHADLVEDGKADWSTWSRILLRAVQDRAAIGLRELPQEVAAVVPLAEEVDRAAPPEDEEWLARRRRRRGGAA